MVQLSCSFATNCRTKCYFSRAGQGRQQPIPLNSWGRRCIPNLRFVRELKLILLRIGLFGDYEGRDFTIYLKYRAQLGMRFRLSGKHKKQPPFLRKQRMIS
ncbi:hypothetical protein pdam_00018189 [Pocillopora damicornis]|uniref:Uncharacterized protein n=1 Tax=Pocillopora damicornis TaxID=46731 RepID=A0A3M6TU65_POCDA|nr:hypothetical protein pdam_00018189 [Pocillopora damicornis]